MPATVAQDFLIQWHVTGRCNLQCAHCYDDGKLADEFSTQELLAAADEIKETLDQWSELYEIHFAPDISLTGGEPLLRRDIFALMERLAAQGFKLSLLTNGTLVDGTVSRCLASLGLDTVQVSLEGPAGLHDQIRGAGSFAKAAAGVRYLAQAGLKVTVNMTLTRLNAPFFKEMVQLSKELGGSRLGFSRLVPAGRGKGLEDMALSLPELAALYQEASRLPEQALGGLSLVTSDPLAARVLQDGGVDAPCGAGAQGEDGDDFPAGGCSAGVSAITLLPDGTLMPCRRMNLAIGNLRTDSLREIWATSPVLEKLRTRESYGPRCSSCRNWAGCRGCRAVAHAVTGDYLADDPHCFLWAPRSERPLIKG